MRLTVHHSCGHEHQHTVYAAMTDTLLQSFQTAQCPDCARGTPRPRLKAEPTQIICSACGAADTVPFKPFEGRTVLCRKCFLTKRRSDSPFRGTR